MRLRQGESAGRGVRNGDTICQPLIAKNAKAVGINQLLGGGQCTTLGRGTAHGDTACRCIIHIRHRVSRGAANHFARVKSIGVYRLHANRLTNMRLRERECCTCCAANHPPIGQPLIRNSPHAIGIVGQGIGGGQNLPLPDGAAYRDTAGRRIIGIGHRTGGATGYAFCRAVPIGITHFHADGFTHLRLGQGEGAGGCATDSLTTGKPLVIQRT